jgi:hypothetical protein
MGVGTPLRAQGALYPVMVPKKYVAEFAEFMN